MAAKKVITPRTVSYWQEHTYTLPSQAIQKKYSDFPYALLFSEVDVRLKSI